MSREEKGSVLGLNDIFPKSHDLTTRDVVKDKHPPGKRACPESLLPDAWKLNPIIYSNLDAECKLHAALHTRVLPASPVLTCMHGGDCGALSSNLPLMTCVMLLLQWNREFAPVISIQTISVHLLQPIDPTEEMPRCETHRSW